MKKATKANNQTTLPGMEQVLCACGCNTYFMRVARGRKRLYVDDTHKKRVARRNAEMRRTETRVFLTPKGIALAEKLAKADYPKLWDMLTIEEQRLYWLAENFDGGPNAFWDAVSMLMRRADLGLFTLREDTLIQGSSQKRSKMASQRELTRVSKTDGTL